ncbi:MAG: PPOX class F420-dependent oxidoreductase [Pseudomonadota bacterium]
MDEKTWREFILSGTRTGKLATVKPSGVPHVVLIWFLMEENSIYFTSGDSTVKTKNLLANPRASLCIDAEDYPYAFDSLECDAVVERLAPEELLPYAVKPGARYCGEARAEEFGKRNAVAGEVLIRLQPTKVIPWAGMPE